MTITTIRKQISLLPKQKEALLALRSDSVNELLYGGAAGGGKSWLGCYWIIKNCLTYENTRWVIGRAVLKTLKETTLNSFYAVSRQLGLKQKVDWTFNAQSNVITFHKTGAEILLKDLFRYPSDPDFDELGSLEITGAFVDECNQIVEKAWEVLKSRIRYQLDENGLVPTIMGSCNPAKNWVYRRFYHPWKLGELPSDKRFIPAKAKDNKFVSIHYLKNLQSLSDPSSRARLAEGDWEYDSNPNRLCSSEAVQALFGSNVAEHSDRFYITADIARFGSDRAVICVWRGYAVIEFVTFDISRTTDIQMTIEALRRKYRIPKDRCIADEDGVGGGVVDSLDIQGFVNNSRPLENPETGIVENFANLQCQCGYKLAEIINNRQMVFECDLSSDDIETITGDLEQLQTWKSDSDGKLRIKPKSEIKVDLGRSPDWRDVLLMRMKFYYKDEEPANLSVLSALI